MRKKREQLHIVLARRERERQEGLTTEMNDLTMEIVLPDEQPNPNPQPQPEMVNKTIGKGILTDRVKQPKIYTKFINYKI